MITAYSTALDAERCDTHQNDYIISNFISQEFQAWDNHGREAKWFDYVHMTLLQATHAYMEAYQKVHQRIYAREFDAQTAEYIKVVDFDQIISTLVASRHADAEVNEQKVTKAKRKLVGCWRGRQVADAMGMPYDIYIESVMTSRMRAWKRNHMPQPYQLYGRLDVEKTAEWWEELQASRIFLAEHEAYKAENYRGLPQQDRYHEWLFKQASLRQNGPLYVAQFIMDGHLPVEVAMRHDKAPPWEKICAHLD